MGDAVGNVDRRKDGAVTWQVVAFWARVLVGVAAALFGAGAVIAMLRPVMLAGEGEPVTRGIRVFAGYLAARNLGLTLMLVIGLVRGERKLLEVLMMFAGVVQVLDGCADVLEGRWVLAPGVWVLALAFLLAASHLHGAMPWRAKT